MDQTQTRIFCVSDLHTDHSKNWDRVYSWAEDHPYNDNGISNQPIKLANIVRYSNMCGRRKSYMGYSSHRDRYQLNYQL